MSYSGVYLSCIYLIVVCFFFFFFFTWFSVVLLPLSFFLKTIYIKRNRSLQQAFDDLRREWRGCHLGRVLQLQNLETVKETKGEKQKKTVNIRGRWVWPMASPSLGCSLWATKKNTMWGPRRQLHPLILLWALYGKLRSPFAVHFKCPGVRGNRGPVEVQKRIKFHSLAWPVWTVVFVCVCVFPCKLQRKRLLVKSNSTFVPH